MNKNLNFDAFDNLVQSIQYFSASFPDFDPPTGKINF